METITSATQDGILQGLTGTVKPALGLVVAWSLEEPERVGEIAWMPKEGQPYILGRGPALPDDPAPRLALQRQRPHGTTTTAPIESPRLSRQQLQITRGNDTINAENLGRAALVYRGQEVDRCTLRPGECLQVKNQLVLLCVERTPAIWPGVDSGGATPPPHPFGEPDVQGLVGESPTAWTLRTRVAFLAGRTQHVLLLGESGTGKELVARAIHQLSPRHRKKPVSRNAATIPEGLFDAELFGNTRDYPNPGMRERVGLAGEADGSTLFLDEIGELPEALQAHLLRLLDEGGEYHRLGETQARHTDLRLVGATNRAPDRLKHDFLARFVLRIEVPPLGARQEDIPLIARHLLRRAALKDAEIDGMIMFEHQGKRYPRIAPDLMEALVTHSYSTHVRELDAILWAAITHSSGGWLRMAPEVATQFASTEEEAPDARLEEVTAEMLEACMKRHQGVQSKVWRELGLKNRYVLRRLLKKFGISGGAETDEDATDA